jgi:hypothetical protein
VDTLFRQLTDERLQKAQLVSNYADAAANDSRDLTDSEQETIGHARSRIKAIDSQLVLLADDLEMADSTRDRLRMVSTAHAAMAHESYRSAGQLLWDLLHQSDETARMRLGHSMKRAAEHMGTDKAKTVPVAGDLAGLIVTPVVGAVIDPYPMASFASSLGLVDNPDALHWVRPRIDDPGFYTGVGEQGTGGTAGFEKAELPSKAFNVTGDAVPMITGGTYLNISQQLLTWVPGSLDLITRHLLRRLAWWIDTKLIAEMQKSTGKVTLAEDGATILAAIYEASANVFTATGALASWIVMGPQGYARLGGLADLAGRPLFPTLGAVNAPGTANAAEFTGTVAGLRAIVTPGISDATFWVGNSMVLEGARYLYPVLEAVEPSVLGRQVAVAASIAGFRPIPNGAQHLAA